MPNFNFLNRQILFTLYLVIGLSLPSCAAQNVRPGEKAGEDTEEGRWAFVYPGDSFDGSSWLDLRHLNEEQSGQHGFIRLSDDGNHFVRGDETPIRFWSVTSYAFNKTPEEMDAHTRFLAKMGVNMVRLHLNIADSSEGSRITDIRKELVDNVWRFVKSCKDAGIYLTISPYWYHGSRLPESWIEDLPGYQPGDRPSGALFFNPVYQNAYKGWIRYLFGETNPYTGLALKDDPALAIIQVKNEDSLLFFTSQRIPEPQVRILSAQYHDWLVKKYGGIDAALQAWEGHQIDDSLTGRMGDISDDPENGLMGLYIIWELTQDTEPGGKSRRLADQLEFFTHTMHSFYADVVRTLREDIGASQLVNPMNWKTASLERLGDAERYANTAGEVIAVNRYFSGIHLGENRGHRIDPGHFILDRSVLKEPAKLPVNLRQVVGAPMLVTESQWVRPNLYQSEGPLLTAAYMSLSGVDSFYWFAHSEPNYQADPRRLFNRVKPGDTGFALNKWTVAVPTQLGMFPASALMFRRGDVREGATVVDEYRSLDDIFDRKIPVITEGESFDPNRDTRDLTLGEGQATDVSRLAYLVGPVRVRYGGEPGPTQVADLSPFIDADRQTVRSNTGELSLNWQAGLFTLDSPRAKAVSGFLKDAGGDFRLDGLRIRSANAYATVQVVSMDGLELANSARVLVQVGTTKRLTGWATRPATFEAEGQEVTGEEILATGKPPFQIVNTEVEIEIDNAVLGRATLLDPAGVPVAEVPVVREDERLRVKLPPNTMYLMLH